MRVQLNASNRSYAFEVKHGESILYAGMRHGLELPYGCASGTCGTCKATCIAGTCHSAWEEAPGLRVGRRDGDAILMCQATPRADSTLAVAATVYQSDPGVCAPSYRSARVAERRLLAPDMMALALELDAPMTYEAGQFVAVEVPGIPGYRMYSMTAFQRGAARLSLLVKRKPGGALTDWLFQEACVNAAVKVFGPLGRATFSPACGKNLLVIAGGSGIAGMMAILDRAAQEGYFARYRAAVFFGVRKWSDRFYLSEFAALRSSFPDRVSIDVALSDEDPSSNASDEFPALRFHRGLVHDVARTVMAGNYASTRAYVAGPPAAVDVALRYLLRDAKLSPLEIRYDKFG